MLKIVSQNKINYFTWREAILSEELRKFGNQFYHDSEVNPSLVLDLTRKLLIEIKKNDENEINLDKYFDLLKNIEDM